MKGTVLLDGCAARRRGALGIEAITALSKASISGVEGRAPVFGVWDDGLLLVGRDAEAVEAAVDRLEDGGACAGGRSRCPPALARRHPL
ncbi:hypothetical protein WMF20_08450 [Sorangium sp. So ce834]|uniref:hypothetical protein n=1 Tax=Sorangium sp. So ce834 TaxID=3133321 RepID=UPI003F5E208E